MSPRWKPNLLREEPLATSTMTTPLAVDRQSRNSSASAGDRLATLAPANGERERIGDLVARRLRRRFERDRTRSGRLPPRSTPSSAVPPSGLVAKR